MKKAMAALFVAIAACKMAVLAPLEGAARG
jgi:hypothetical protein